MTFLCVNDKKILKLTGFFFLSNVGMSTWQEAEGKML